jgi:ppGpp synthetase/RelA/SpoT-type nucleotidyltranferase
VTGMEPAALASTYKALRPSLEKLASYTRTRLRAELDPLAPVAIEPRIKELGSVHEKLQTGSFESLRSLEDLVGVKVVVLRRSEIEPVAVVVGKSFQLVREKERVIDPTVFRYRERHLVIKPPHDFLDRNADLKGLVVEVQLTSVVQHALDQVTHDFDYKGSTLDWAKFRLVAQLRASLELVDNLLDSMDASAKLIEESVQFPDDLLQRNAVLVVMTSVFEEEALPGDRRRLAETATTWLTAAGLEPGDLEALLGRHPELVRAHSISPLDAVLGSLLRERPTELIATFQKKFVISDELRTLCAAVDAVPADRIVDLS